MGLVEVCTSVNTILSQLEKEKRGLQKIDEHIKKSVVTNRFQNDRNADRSFQGNQNDGPRGGRNMNRIFYSDGPNRSFDDDNRSSRKRPQETKTVFSRLSGRVPVDSDGEEETSFSKKPRISSQVTRELPTKQEVLKAQAGDEVSKVRNRRMFGSLLGTLQKFKQEEIILKNKEEKKAQVEKKIEEQAKQEKENQKRERQSLFAEREMKKASIKALEAKMIRLESYEAWEKTQKPLLNYIQTKWKPQIYWLPKKMNSQAKEKYDLSRARQEKLIEDKQKELKEELEAIEQKCLRNMKILPGMKNRPTSLSDTLQQEEDANQSVDEEEEEDEETQGHDEEMEEGEIISNIKQEKDNTEKQSRVKPPPTVNVKIEKDVKVNKPSVKEDESDSDSSSSSDDGGEEEHNTSEDENSQNGEGIKMKTVKTEVNGDHKTEEKQPETKQPEDKHDNPPDN